jgi:hypothetical protein
MLRELADLGFDHVELGHGIRFSLWPDILRELEKGENQDHLPAQLLSISRSGFTKRQSQLLRILRPLETQTRERAGKADP